MKKLSQMTNAELKKFIRNTQNMISRDKRKNLSVADITLSTKGLKTRSDIFKEVKKAVEYRKKKTQKIKTEKKKNPKPKKTALDRMYTRTLEQFNKLKKSTLQREVKQLEKEVKKRITELEKAGLKNTPTAQFLKKGYEYNPNNLASLREYYKRLRSFLMDSRSTVEGEKSLRERIKSALFDKNVIISSSKYDDFFNILDKSQELFSQVFDSSIKYEVMNEIRKEMDKGKYDIDDLAIKIADFAENAYKRTQAERLNEFIKKQRTLFNV